MISSHGTEHPTVLTIFPRHWTPPTVLNTLHGTEQILYRAVISKLYCLTFLWRVLLFHLSYLNIQRKFSNLQWLFFLIFFPPFGFQEFFIDIQICRQYKRLGDWYHGGQSCSCLVVGSMEALLFFLLPDRLKLNNVKSRMGCRFSDIFSRHISSTVAETTGVTNYAASFGAKKCSETTFEAAEMMFGPWNQRLHLFRISAVNPCFGQ